MNDFTPDNLTAAARRIALTAEEKAASRERLVSYMAMVPVRAARTEQRGPFFSALGAGFRAVHMTRAAAVFSLVGAVTLSGAGVSYAAESALPGDTLYPVKVAVNEEVRAALASTDAGKAEWEAERAARRLAETEALAEKGRLDAARRAEMEARYAEHAARAKERMEKLRAMQDDGPGRADEVEARLEGAIAAHAKIIAAISAEHPDAPTATIASLPVAASAIAIEDTGDDADDTEDAERKDAERADDDRDTRVREEIARRSGKTFENQKDSDVAGATAWKIAKDATAPKTGDDAKDAAKEAAKKVAAARGLETAAAARRATAVRLIADSRAKLPKIADKLDAEAMADAQARLAAADAVVAEGDALLAAGDAKLAAEKFLAAQKMVLEAQRLVGARIQLKVKVKLNALPEKSGPIDVVKESLPRLREARQEERGGRQ